MNKKTKFWRPLPLLAALLLSISLMIPQLVAIADVKAGFFDISPAENYGNPPHPAEGTSGEEIVKQLVTGVFSNLKGIISGLTIAFIVYAGFRMVTAQNEEAVITEQKHHLLWAFIGLAILGVATALQKIFECRLDGRSYLCLFSTPEEITKRVVNFNKQVEIILTFGRYVIGSVAILYLVLNGARLVTSGHSEDINEKAKKNFAATIVALVLIMIANHLVNKVLFVLNSTSTPIPGVAVQPGLNTGKGLELLGQLTRFIVTFAGPVAILMMIIAAITYVTAGGEEERMTRAKTIVKSTVIGLIVIYGAYAIVATFITGNIAAAT